MEHRIRGKGPLAPRLPRDFEPTELSPADVEDGETYRSFQLANADFKSKRTHHVTFEQASLSTVNFTGTRMELGTWVDVLFQGCDLSNARWEKGTLIRTEIKDSRLVGFSLGGEGHLENVQLVDCNCHLASFRFTRLKAVSFKNCNLTEADFQGCDLSSVTFVGCDLRSVEMSQAKMRGVDLRGSQIDGIRAGPAELRGAVIDPVQAAIIAQAMGLTVAWPEG
jgi:uncharacterized protein YjbI with pentapeptide repeats